MKPVVKNLSGEGVHCLLFLKERPLCSISFYTLWRVKVPQMESCPCGEGSVKMNLSPSQTQLCRGLTLLNCHNYSVSRNVFLKQCTMGLMCKRSISQPGSCNQHHPWHLKKCIQETVSFVFRTTPDPESKGKQWEWALTNNRLLWWD